MVWLSIAEEYFHLPKCYSHAYKVLNLLFFRIGSIGIGADKGETFALKNNQFPCVNSLH